MDYSTGGQQACHMAKVSGFARLGQTMQVFGKKPKFPRFGTKFSLPDPRLGRRVFQIIFGQDNAASARLTINVGSFIILKPLLS